ncbi:MAG: DUF2914 domain-containing protein [Desulfobacteraceae bacterium]|jgi:hypothetical protein|nr:DUF2914 domain-containing protein [Desulfobacteraceae bacterium]
MKYPTFLLLLLTLGFFLLLPISAGSQSGNPIALVDAVMCEDIKGNVPQNLTTVFSIERQTAVCFTTFDPVPQQAVIYHHWFHRDKPSARIKLTLKPPRWSTFSSIQLRVEDIGPWRVEITDSQGNIYRVLRFSVTE